MVGPHARQRFIVERDDGSVGIADLTTTRALAAIDPIPFRMNNLTARFLWRSKLPIAFETDRERDADTLASGFVTVRVTEERLDERPEREAERLHAILKRRRSHAPSAA